MQIDPPPVEPIVCALLGTTLLAAWLTLPFWAPRPASSSFTPVLITAISLGVAVSSVLTASGLVGIVKTNDSAPLTPEPLSPPLSIETAIQAAPLAIESPNPVYFGPSDRRAIALVFDDGPHPHHTAAILDLLAEAGAKSSFAVLGQRVDRYPEIVRRAAGEGHTIVSHGYSHADFTSLSSTGLSKELNRTRDALRRAGVPTVSWVRPPYGKTSDTVTSAIAEEGARVLLWSVDPQDWNSDKTPDQIAADIILHAAPGAILVVHDTKANTVEATRIVLSALAGRFNFVTVDELMHPVAPIPAENKDPATAIPVVTF